MAKFRTIQPKEKRVINPRTKQDDGKSAVETSTKDQYVPILGNPQDIIAMFRLQPWVIACKRAIASAVAAIQINVVYKPPTEGESVDAGKIKLLKAFLEKDAKEYKTVQERIKALAIDFVMLDYACIEIARNADGIPSAWYHVPAVTVRELKDGGYVQLENNKIIAEFAPYQAGWNKAKQREMIVVKEYDPAALYMSAMDGVSLLETITRLGRQDDYNNQLLKAGNIPPFLLMLKEALDDDSYKRFSAYINALGTGEDSDTIGLLDGIGEGHLEKLAMDVSEAGYVETEKLLRERILAVMQVPPSKLGLPIVNYAVAQQEDATFRFGRVMPIVNMLLHRLNIVADEIVPDDGYEYCARPQTYEDYLQVAQAENILVNNGIHSRNDARNRLGDENIGEEGDVLTIGGPMGITPLASAVKNSTPTVGRALDSLLEIRRILAEVQRERERGTTEND